MGKFKRTNSFKWNCSRTLTEDTFMTLIIKRPSKPSVLFSKVEDNQLFIHSNNFLCQKYSDNEYMTIADSTGKLRSQRKIITLQDSMNEFVKEILKLKRIPIRSPQYSKIRIPYSEVKSDQLFANDGGWLCQKMSEYEYNIIAFNDGRLICRKRDVPNDYTVTEILKYTEINLEY